MLAVKSKGPAMLADHYSQTQTDNNCLPFIIPTRRSAHARAPNVVLKFERLSVACRAQEEFRF